MTLNVRDSIFIKRRKFFLYDHIVNDHHNYIYYIVAQCFVYAKNLTQIN